MFNKKSLDELVKQLLDAIPSHLRVIPKELEKQFHQILQTALIKMDLVTREEFEAQVRVLQRTREKLEMLEKELAVHEQQEKNKIK